ncbi:MAG: MarR family transcriptional regulator [Thermoleophilia bacterium]|nr:MarR family transcriptional regulator [Thermoleophilia bacterium]
MSPVAPAEGMEAITARAGYMMGPNAARAWTADEATAWEGLLEVARRLRREAEALLEARHGLSVSMLGLMGRLAGAKGGRLRLTDLAAAMGLSVSRASRVTDLLEREGLVARERCPADARATDVVLTAAGRTRARAAQDTTHAYVRAAFADRLHPDEAAVLARVVTRLLEPPSGPA